MLNKIKGVVFTESDYFVSEERRNNKVEELLKKGYIVNTYETFCTEYTTRYWYEVHKQAYR